MCPTAHRNAATPAGRNPVVCDVRRSGTALLTAAEAIRPDQEYVGGQEVSQTPEGSQAPPLSSEDGQEDETEVV